MRLTYDWATSNTAERVLNLVLRPLGLDCFVETHTVGAGSGELTSPVETTPPCTFGQARFMWW
jgi:hypothetical protein